MYIKETSENEEKLFFCFMDGNYHFNSDDFIGQIKDNAGHYG